MLQINPKDYVLAQEAKDGGKPRIFLLRTTKLSEKMVTGILERPDVHINPSTVSFDRTQIFANLGAKPVGGKVYGFDTNQLYRGSRVISEHFPEFHAFDRPSKENREALTLALDSIAATLKRKSLMFLLEHPTLWELHPKKGKYAGMFHCSKNTEKAPDKISITISDETKELEPKLGYKYVIAHELGHKLHLRFAGANVYPKLNATWLSLYQTSIHRHSVLKTLSSKLMKKLLSSESVGEFLRELPDEEKICAKMILRSIKQEHNLQKTDLDILLATRDPERLQAIWPTTDVFGAIANPILTAYATKNYKELIAETFAYFVLGMKLPDSLSELMERTCAQARKTAKTLAA